MPPPWLPASARTPRRAGEGLHLPGSQWLSITLPAPQRLQNEILASLYRAAGDWAGLIRHWHWLRYDNAAHGPHLRVRFHGDPATLGGRLLPALSRWCSELIGQRLARGFTVEPYDQEIERYGGPDAIAAAEAVFAADSNLVLAALAISVSPDEHLVIAALSAAAIARTTGSGLAALHGRQLDRAGRAHLTAIRPAVRAAAADLSAALIPGTHPAWTARRAALAAYRDTLQPAARPACASSVIHMHANRLLGDSAAEPLVRALAADILARDQP